jgi:hypothetical protein
LQSLTAAVQPLSMQPVSNPSPNILSAASGAAAPTSTVAVKPLASSPDASFAGLVHEILQRPNDVPEKSRDGQPASRNGKDAKKTASTTAAAITPSSLPSATRPVAFPAHFVQATWPGTDFREATGVLATAIQSTVQNLPPGSNGGDKTTTLTGNASGALASAQKLSLNISGFAAFSSASPVIAGSSILTANTTSGRAIPNPASDSAAASTSVPQPLFDPTGTLATSQPNAPTSQDAVPSASQSFSALSGPNFSGLTAAIPTGPALFPADPATAALPLAKNSESLSSTTAPGATGSDLGSSPSTADISSVAGKFSASGVDHRAPASSHFFAPLNSLLGATGSGLVTTASSVAPVLHGTSLPSSRPEIKLPVPGAVERNTAEASAWTRADSQTDTQTKPAAAATLMDAAQSTDAVVASALSLGPLVAPSTSDTSKISTPSGHSGPVAGGQIAATTATGDATASQDSTTSDDAKNPQNGAAVSSAPAPRSAGGNNFAPTLEDATKSAALTGVNSAPTPTAPPITTHSPAAPSAAAGPNNNSTHETSTSDPQNPPAAPGPEHSGPGQFVTDASLAQNAGHSDIHIAMQTDSLGSIELHARVSGDSVGAAITVERRDAHTALAADLPALQQSLSDKQLRVEHITLTHAPLDSTAGQASSQQFGEQPNHGHRAPSNIFEGANHAGSSNLHSVGGFGADTSEIFDSQGRLSVRA